MDKPANEYPIRGSKLISRTFRKEDDTKNDIRGTNRGKNPDNAIYCSECVNLLSQKDHGKTKSASTINRSSKFNGLIKLGK